MTDITSNGTVLVAAGRLMIDIWTQLTVEGFAEGDWVGEINEIRVDVGGPVHVCEGFLNAQSGQAILVSALGGVRSGSDQLLPDTLGILALNRLEAKGIIASCMLVEHKQTGRVILLYPPSSGRLMVSDTVTAPHVSGEYVEAVIGEALAKRSECLIFVDGYLYFDKSCSDVPEALARRRRDKCRLWVDVLPHTLYKSMSLRDFLRHTEAVDLVTMERTTLEGFATENLVEESYVTTAILQQCAALALVDDGLLTIIDQDGEEVIVYKKDDGLELELDHTPGQRDKIVAELVTNYLCNKQE
jgi:hypothetical protein